VFSQEANMHENKYNNYTIPAGLLIVFLEKALTLIHMETHLNDVRSITISLPISFALIERWDKGLYPAIQFIEPTLLRLKHCRQRATV
jgi:hypothetical protein